ncbi:hypothetical protein BS78_09G009600 [Paspalum vaginatum]|nr:hypothetical protein BS78_09G009600 [Paspalum vaginatum]
MATFPSLKPQHHISARSCRVAAPEPVTLIRRSPPPSISWRRQQRTSRLQCCQLQLQQTSSSARSHVLDDKGDSRLRKSIDVVPPSIWGSFFLGYSDRDASPEQKTWMERAAKLKEEVALMVAANSSATSGHGLHGRLHFIDALERLCLDHLFEQEINAALEQIQDTDVSDCDLGTVALWFYLLRKHRYRVSPDVFVRFKDAEGGFLANNPTELLSLYSAAHLKTHGEIILDEAITFTRRRLETILPNVEGSLAREIKSSLEIPLPRRVRIYESKHYISIYEKDAARHDKVLELAKLNSNIMQLHHQQELSMLTRWWEDMKIQSMLPLARDRIAECFLWILGVYFEPCHSRARIISTMVITIVTLLDDIFDSYASLEQCEILTDCIQSWDLKPAQDLPECIRFPLEKILNSYELIANMLHQEEKYRMLHLRYFTEDLVRGFTKEAKMLNEGYTPKTVEEHLNVSLRTGGCLLLSCASFVGMHDIVSEDFYDWVSSVPKMVKALAIILRLVNDLQSDEREQVIPHVALTIHSYMKEHKVSIEVACEKIHLLKEESWTDFNSEWLNPNNVYPKQLLERIFNLTRTMEFMYYQEDIFSNCHNLKDTIHLLLVEPFTTTI